MLISIFVQMGSHLLLYISFVMIILTDTSPVTIILTDHTEFNSQVGCVRTQHTALPPGSSAWRELSSWLMIMACWEEAEARGMEEQIGQDYSLLSDSEAGLFVQDVGG